MTIILISSYYFSYAECTTVPAGMELAQSIEAGEITKAKSLLESYKKDVANYLKKCGNSKEKREETSILVHTYKARLEDVEFTLNKKPNTTDCSKVPSHTALSKAFEKKTADIESLYHAYKKDSENYIEHCASHLEYETVYESAMLCDEMYDEWKQKK